MQTKHMNYSCRKLHFQNTYGHLFSLTSYKIKLASILFIFSIRDLIGQTT